MCSIAYMQSHAKAWKVQMRIPEKNSLYFELTLILLLFFSNRHWKPLHIKCKPNVRSLWETLQSETWRQWSYRVSYTQSTSYKNLLNGGNELVSKIIKHEEWSAMISKPLSKLDFAQDELRHCQKTLHASLFVFLVPCSQILSWAYMKYKISISATTWVVSKSKMTVPLFHSGPCLPCLDHTSICRPYLSILRTDNLPMPTPFIWYQKVRVMSLVTYSLGLCIIAILLAFKLSFPVI